MVTDTYGDAAYSNVTGAARAEVAPKARIDAAKAGDRLFMNPIRIAPTNRGLRKGFRIGCLKSA